MTIVTASTNKTLKWVFTILTVAASLTLSGCMQSNAATQISFDSEGTVTEPMLRSVNAAFRTTILGGNWYYQGAQAVNGTINAYIQIPDKLNMSRSDQEKYLQMSLCPSSSKHAMWQQIKDIPLSVHVYTYNKKHTVYAHCENPMSKA